jgi:hypothetical protein
MSNRQKRRRDPLGRSGGTLLCLIQALIGQVPTHSAASTNPPIVGC